MYRNSIFDCPLSGWIAFYACLLWTSTCSCNASSNQVLAEEIKSFNEGNFASAAAIGKSLVTANPTNTTARYYYGQALAKLNRTSEAVLQFSQCANMAKDPKLKSYSQKALENLTRVSVTPSASSSKLFDDSKMEQPHTESNPLPTQGVELNSLKLKIMEAGSQEIKVLREQADRDIQEAKNVAAEQMQGIPQFFIRPYYVNGVNTRQYPNADYPAAFERSQTELAKATEKINANFNRREAEIMAECKRRTAGYDQVGVGMRSQGKPGISDIQLTPQNSNSYLRHYVNYDGRVPVALKAQAGALVHNNPKTEAIVQKTAK